jgi:hypothetical protein
MQIDIVIVHSTPNSTLSKVLLDGHFFCFVIEDGYREKKVPGMTRIPDGTYQVKPRTHGGFYTKYARLYGHKFVPQIMDVPGFGDILFHCGNTVEDTRGCLLLNTWAGFSRDKQVFSGRESTPVYMAFYVRLASAFAGNEAVTVTLNRDVAV